MKRRWLLFPISFAAKNAKFAKVLGWGFAPSVSMLYTFSANLSINSDG